MTGIRALTTGALPLLADATPPRHRAATATAAILVAWMAAHLASTTFGIGARSHAVDVVVPAADLEAWLGAGGFVLAHDEHVEGAGAMDALDPIQLDVRGRART